MSFQTRMSEVARQFIKHVVGAGISDSIVMSGSSDGGAHLASFVGADYPTKLLTDWTPDPVSLERAVWQLAGMPATVHGLRAQQESLEQAGNGEIGTSPGRYAPCERERVETTRREDRHGEALEEGRDYLSEAIREEAHSPGPR